MSRPPGHEPGTAARVATFLLLLGGGVALLFFAMRLVAAAFGCGFSPFVYLGLPESHGWQAFLYVVLIAAGIVLVWLAGDGGGVLVPSAAIEELLLDGAREHPDVVHVEADVRVRRGRLSARLAVDLRPLADGDGIAAALGAQARDALARVTGIADVDVRVRARVLTVKRLPGRLP
jgi:drug/metabolite transporter (DMT)-like permease